MFITSYMVKLLKTSLLLCSISILYCEGLVQAKESDPNPVVCSTRFIDINECIEKRDVELRIIPSILVPRTPFACLSDVVGKKTLCQLKKNAPIDWYDITHSKLEVEKHFETAFPPIKNNECSKLSLEKLSEKLSGMGEEQIFQILGTGYMPSTDLKKSRTITYSLTKPILDVSRNELTSRVLVIELDKNGVFANLRAFDLTDRFNEI